MCGIAGLLQLDGSQPDGWILDRMHRVMAHRGPDGIGRYLDGPVGLAHRRLSIIDLSDAAAQPMGNEDDQVLLTYNGEIYNFPELRAELEAAGHTFRSRTDSEILIHGYEEWGDAVVERANGMFAFALWDRRRQLLTVARDRYGVKPLYWYARDGVFIFASEIKAILEHPAVRREMSYEALNEYFSFQNVLSDRTLFDGIRLLPAATILTVGIGHEVRTRTYWDYPFDREPLDISEAEAAEETHRLFIKAVERQLVSDVPVGAYLSGGMDSGSISMVAGHHLDRLRTFTAGFDLSSASGLELGFDERKSAEFMSSVLKTEHYEVVLHAGDMEHVLPELIWHLEDLRVGQCYPNYYVARLASRFVKVVLSGAGGDELFGGYPWRYYRGVASTDRDDYMRRYYEFWQRLVPDAEKEQLFNDATRARISDLSTFDQFRSVFDRYGREIDDRDGYFAASLYFELKTFLPGLLIVEDKLSMAHSLETRVPFLDNDLVDFAVRLPAHHKVRDLDALPKVDENAAGKRQRFELETSEGKAVLRRAMAHIIPAEVASRTKQGFSAPDASWFRGESIDYINRLLREPDARIYEFLSPRYITSVLDEHTSGKINHRLLIWSLLSLEWWVRTFLDRSDPAPIDRALETAGVDSRADAP
ncbi:MAG TPA: asparagine synthase (glutamine-hydrolyzing) [Candidatus Limnocylindria bacterium]|nr:asparagine synthase (glutamine-hydrolyzing) [Candidatus Limnocylindria bacterium]